MRLLERQQEFMKTTITIKVVQHDESTVSLNSAIEEAFGEFDRIVKKYTRFDENSELSNLNRRSTKWTKVSDEFFMLIQKMLAMAEQTDGAFDPTIIDFLEVYGYDKNYDFSKLEDTNLDNYVKDLVKNRHTWSEIELNEETKEVKLAEKQRLDLGGIGKGYAIDCAFNKLIQVTKNFLIDAGGDIRATGKNQDGKTWTVSLKSEHEVVGEIELTNGESVASSGSWARKVRNFHHLINPKDGKPVEAKYNTVFIKAEDATTADSWATALFVNPNLKIPNNIYQLIA